MGKKTLCISVLDDSMQCLEVERQHSGFFLRSSAILSTGEALMAACKGVDEIYVNGNFPTTLYELENFPKIKKRLLKSLVTRSAQEKIGSETSLDVRFRITGTVTEGAVTKNQISYVAVDKRDISAIQLKLQRQFAKVANISPLPLSLAALVKATDKPDKDFIVVWVGEEFSIISINSPNGEVRLARSVPVGLPHNISLPELLPTPPPAPVAEQAAPEEMSSVGADLELTLETSEKQPAGSAGDGGQALYEGIPYSIKEFSGDIERELSMTTTFFKQKFRQAPPATIYFLGSRHLESINSRFPLPYVEELDVHYGLSQTIAQGASVRDINENIHLLSSLYLSADFSFLPEEETLARQSKMGTNVALGLMLVLSAAGGLWAQQKTMELKLARHTVQENTLAKQQVEQQIDQLQGALERLEPIKSRKQLYDDQILSQPSWINVLNELAALVPQQVVISNFVVSPSNKSWEGAIDGEIRAENWREGLKILREFGKSLHSAPRLDVTKVDYTLGGMETAQKTYIFHLAIKLFSEKQ